MSDPMIHDAEYYIVEIQNREKWAAEDADLDTRLAELREKHGTPPNIIHIMFDDLAFGDLGIPAMAAIRGFNTPNIYLSKIYGLGSIGPRLFCAGI